MAVKKKKEETKVTKKRIPKSLDIGTMYICNDNGNIYYWICLDIKKSKTNPNEYLYYGFTSVKPTGIKDVDDDRCILDYYSDVQIYYSEENLLEFRELKSPKLFGKIEYNSDSNIKSITEIYKLIRGFKYNTLMKSIKEDEVKDLPFMDVVYDYYQKDERLCSVVFSYYDGPYTIRGHLILPDNYIECMNFDLKTVLQAFENGNYKPRGYLSSSQHEDIINNCFTGIGRFLNKTWFDELKKFES